MTLQSAATREGVDRENGLGPNEPLPVLMVPAVSAPGGQGRELVCDPLPAAAARGACLEAPALQRMDVLSSQPNTPTQAGRDLPPCIQTK